MADVVTGRYLFYDSTNEEITQLVRVQGLFWVSDAALNRDIASADSFLLQDADGNKILGKRAEAAGDGLEIWFGFEGLPIKGIDIQTLDGGVVWMLLKDEIKA